MQNQVSDQDGPYQNATTACDETSSVPATTVLVSELQATESTGAFFARGHDQQSTRYKDLNIERQKIPAS